MKLHEEIMSIAGIPMEQKSSSVNVNELEAKANLIRSVSYFVREIKELERYWKILPGGIYNYSTMAPVDPKKAKEIKDKLKTEVIESLSVIKKYVDQIFEDSSSEEKKEEKTEEKSEEKKEEKSEEKED